MKVNSKKYRILITGGIGFIGRYLVKELLNNNNNFVTVIDNEYRWGKDILEQTCQSQNLKYIKGDITNEDLISKLIKENDLIVHLASISQVMTSIQDPDKTFSYNIYGTYLIAKHCSLFGKKLIFSSSREVYGSADYLPVDLNHKLKPENPYGASKISGESLILGYGKSFNLNYIIFRLSNVYGYSDKERVIPIFIKRALKNQNLILFGNKKIIDFIYIDDVISAFLEVIKNNKINNKILNIGLGEKRTLKELAELVVKTIDSKSKIIIEPERKGEVDKFVADISKTQETLKKWKPEIDLEIGLKMMINRYK